MLQWRRKKKEEISKESPKLEKITKLRSDKKELQQKIKKLEKELKQAELKIERLQQKNEMYVADNEKYRRREYGRTYYKNKKR